eukprot:TRINITY_DN29699_c0_g1_i1.p1 TRINITY_DN29699_c0_g1~~TRINITY_DN29699_c0_g1_i1.p1  ORF type:complete len:468 (-),score=74.56 TRINITY_DN29699_c0_g1_i1:33-1436(-)
MPPPPSQTKNSSILRGAASRSRSPVPAAEAQEGHQVVGKEPTVPALRAPGGPLRGVLTQRVVAPKRSASYPATMATDKLNELQTTEQSDSESSEEEFGRWTQVLLPTQPLPKKMPRPVQKASVPKLRPTAAPYMRQPVEPVTFSKASSSSSSSSPAASCNQAAFKPKSLSQAATSPEQGTAARGSLPTMLHGGVPMMTSTGLRPMPPSLSNFRDSRRCPLPGLPPNSEPPFFSLLPPSKLADGQLSLPAPPGSLPLAIGSNDTIALPCDDDAAAVGLLLNGAAQKGASSQDLEEIGKALQVLKMKGINLPLGGGLPPGITGGNSGGGFYSGSGSWLTALPPSLAVERVVDVSEVRFSQRSMKRRFSDGRHLEELIRALQLNDPRCNPMTAEFLKLTVVEKSDEKGQRALYSKDNRRLWCLKEYQRRSSGKPVPIRVRILPWHDVVDAIKFQKNYDTQTDGQDIVIRQ